MSATPRDRTTIRLPRFGPDLQDGQDDLLSDSRVADIYSHGFSHLRVVTPSAHPSLRRGLETFAWYFKRESRYDFIQYGHYEKETSFGFLWLDTEVHYPKEIPRSSSADSEAEPGEIL